MESIWNIVNGNREECIKFLEGQPDKKYVFVEYDVDESEWVNPHEKGEDKSCYVDECAPFVTYSNDNGYFSEYIVTEIHLEEYLDETAIFVKAVNVQDYADRIDVPWYACGASECYIYEMMMDLNLV